ncbi:MAG: hypothetical protein COB04_08930 [Gammaproteobacteria bacterium]|nr:MAG: hypothetical protein COB04_08930 [Gammaproteobacteria bacterium]
MARITPSKSIRALKANRFFAFITVSLCSCCLIANTGFADTPDNIPPKLTPLNAPPSITAQPLKQSIKPASPALAIKPIASASPKAINQPKPNKKPQIKQSSKSQFNALRQKALPLISRQLKRQAEEAPPRTDFKYPFIAIIIDDIGYSPYLGSQAINLPGPVTYSVLPHTPNGFRLAKQAYYLGKEVMLHAPMESLTQKRLGEGGLTLAMTEENFLQTLRENLSQIPFLAGVNNHMGSLLTQHSEPMGWFMEELMHRNMYFVDSRTTPSSIAAHTAEEFNIPYLIRDVFLDNDASLWGVHKSFLKLIDVARRDGSAIAIGHPYPSTLAYLAEAIPTLKQRGITLIPVSEMLETQTRKTVRYFAKPKKPSPQTASTDNKIKNDAI